jgi:hypothetical protein
MVRICKIHTFIVKWLVASLKTPLSFYMPDDYVKDQFTVLQNKYFVK